MEKYILIIGLNDKDTKLQQISTLEAYKVVSNIICAKTGGGTIFEANGIYTHEDGTVIIEKSLRAEILTDDEKAVNEIIDYLKVALNQESILKICEIVNYSFI